MAYQTIVIGGGPAGLFAAMQAANHGGKVLLLEKNKRLGKRLLASGGGMCNYTCADHIKTFLTAYGDNGSFLRKALYGFNNEKLMDFFIKRGNKPLIREDGKVFSGTEKAIDLLNIMVEECRCREVTIRTECTVREIKVTEDGFDVWCYGQQYHARTVVIASGGASRKGLGGTLDGCELARSLGHHIIQTRPSLTPVMIKDWKMNDLAGLSFETIMITLWRNDRKIAKYQDDLVITHHGLSGPVILNGSRWMQADDTLEVNFIGMPYERCMQQVKELLNKYSKRTLLNVLYDLDVPKRLVAKLCNINDINPNQQSANVSKVTIKKICTMLCQHRMQIQELEGYERAMTMAGGVDINEIDPKTMQSKKVSGLFFAGEVMNIDGDTGGYNIQAACSTGYLAGTSCAVYESKL